MKKIESRITIISIFVGLVGIVGTVFSYLYPTDNESHNFTVISNQALPRPGQVSSNTITTTPPVNTYNSNFSVNTRLIISGVGVEVTINEGESGIPYSGGVISSIGSVQVVYLPKGQLLSVNLTGTGAHLAISRSIAEQVQVDNSGVGADVSFF